MEVMSVIIRLQNLPWNANALDIRQFFYSLSIPDGGVHIIGGEKGDAFIAFSTDEDARRAMMNDGGKINDLPIRLFLSSKAEMQNVIVSARSTSLPMGSVTKEPFGRPPVQEALGGDRGFDGYEYAAQKNRGVPSPGNTFSPALGMGVKRDGWSQNVGQGNPSLQFPVRGEFPLMGSTNIAKALPDMGLRPQLDKPTFGQMNPAFDTPTVGGGPVGEAGIQGRFGSEWGALSAVGREAGAFLRDGRGSGLGEFGNLMQQQSMERGFARGGLDSRMHEEISTGNSRWLGNQEGQVGLGKSDLGREFGRTEDDFGRGMQKLPERPGVGRPELGRDFMMKDPGSEYRNVDSRHEFGRPDLARENLGRDMSGITPEERLRRFIDAQGLGQNQSEGRDLGRPFATDASRMPPFGSRDLRMPGSDFGSRDREMLRPDAVPRPDVGPGFPMSEFSRSTLLGREFERGGLGLDAARLGARDDALIRDAREDVRGFGSDRPGGFPPRPGFGRGEQGPGNNQSLFEPDARRLPFDNNFRGENPALRLLGPPRDFLNTPRTPRDFLDRLSEAGPGLRGRFDERGLDEGSRRDRISSGSGGGVWIRAINLPLSYNYREVRRFFNGCDIPSNSLKLVNDRSGCRTGLAYVRFNNVQTAVNSLKLSGRLVDGCRVTVESCGEAEYENAVDNFKPLLPRDNRVGRSRSRSPVRRHISPDREVKVCVVVKTLSSKTTEADIRAYFSKSCVAKNGGPFLEIDFDGRPTGCALVQFDSVQDFDEAIFTNRRHRSLNGVDVKVIGIKRGEFEDRSKKARLSVTEKVIPPTKTATSTIGGAKGPVKPEPRAVVVASSLTSQNTAASIAEKEKSEKPTTESSEGKPCCVELRGVPWITTVATIKDFFKGLNIAENGIHVILDHEGRAAGSVYVEFASSADCMKGLERNRQYIGKRYVNIVLIGKKQMLAGIGNQKTMSIADACNNSGGPPSGKPAVKSEPGKETTVSLKNLSFQTQLEDILEFFQGYHPIVDSIKLQYKDGKPTGDGLTTFPDVEEAQGVIRLLNRKPLLGRPIMLSLWK